MFLQNDTQCGFISDNGNIIICQTSWLSVKRFLLVDEKSTDWRSVFMAKYKIGNSWGRFRKIKNSIRADCNAVNC